MQHFLHIPPYQSSPEFFHGKFPIRSKKDAEAHSDTLSRYSFVLSYSSAVPALLVFLVLLLFLTLFPFQQEDSSPNANYGKNDVAYPPALPERILVHILGAVT